MSKAETLLDEARQQAVANALRRAKLYATAAGAEVGEVLTIIEGGRGPAGQIVMTRAVSPQAVPIERGTETLNAVPTVQAFTQENFERRAFGVAVERDDWRRVGVRARRRQVDARNRRRSGEQASSEFRIRGRTWLCRHPLRRMSS